MYQRKEDESIQTLYRIDAPWAHSLPEDLERFVEQVARRGRLARDAKEFSVEPAALGRTAQVFVEEAAHVFHFTLSPDNEDATQLDRFAEAHLIDPVLRPFFVEGRLREGEQGELAAQWSQAVGQCCVPNESVLLYAMGAFWGEWLVRQRRCRWALYAPLNPVQSFPDFLTAGGTVCVQPFSQVCGKLVNPVVGNLAFKAQGLTAHKHYFPPFPLLASPADAMVATVQMLPEPARRALAAKQRGSEVEAFGLLLQASNEDPENAQVLHMIVMAAWSVKRYDILEGASYHLLDLLPDHPVVNHNLASLYANRADLLPKAVPLLEKALEADPQFGRAHLTLASCLRDLGRPDEARQHAAWVRDHEGDLKAEAEGLLRELSGPDC